MDYRSKNQSLETIRPYSQYYKLYSGTDVYESRKIEFIAQIVNIVTRFSGCLQYSYVVKLNETLKNLIGMTTSKFPQTNLRNFQTLAIT